MKNLFITLGILIIIIGSYIFITNNKKHSTDVSILKSIAMCYQYSKTTPHGYTDRAWLKMNIAGDKVTGEYRNLPAETDSKIGTFTGTVSAMDPKISGRIANVLWDSEAEGVKVKEQLRIEFGEDSAVALFGEMIDRGDGIYVYKDDTNLTPGFQMSQIDCESLQDITTVEQYVRDNIKALAPEKPVLGGSWYVIAVYVNPSTKSGTMTYEDGHIQGKASFQYVRNGAEILISSVNPIK